MVSSPPLDHFSGPTGIETVSRNQSIQTALPGIAVALSKNPEAVDGILDALEEIKKHLSILQPNTSPWWMQNNHKKEISALMQKTTELEDQVIKWDAYRDILLDGMSRRLNGLALTDWWRRKLSPRRLVFSTWHRDIESKTQIQKAVLEILEAVVTVLDIMRQELEVMQESASVLSEKMDVFTYHAGERNTGQISLVGRFVSWSLPFAKTPKTKHRTKTEELNLLDKAQSIHPQLQALHASIEKAHHWALTASTLIISPTESWLKSLGRKVGRSEKAGNYFKDVMLGISDTCNLSLKLIEQKMDQREDRKMVRWDVVLEAERNLRPKNYWKPGR
jgi:hypothetical protein